MFWTSILSSLKSAFSWIVDPKNRTIILAIVIGLLTFYIFTQRDNIKELRAQNNIHQNNISALSDSLTSYHNQNNIQIFEIGALVANLKDLRKLNSSLANTVDSLENNPTTITETEIQVERDTVFVNDFNWIYSEEKDLFKINWNFTDSGNWGSRSIKGYNQFSIRNDSTIVPYNQVLTKDSFVMNVVTGFRETDDGKLKTYATTSFPNATFNSVESAVLDPSKFSQNSSNQSPNRWGIGLQAGYGLNVLEMKSSPYIGGGISYNFITF